MRHGWLGFWAQQPDFGRISTEPLGDETFRQHLLKDPKKAIEKEFDIKVPQDMSIAVHEENEHSLHLIVPSIPPHFISGDLSDDELKDVIGGVMATGHLATLPNARERQKLRELERENHELKKTIEKLKIVKN